VDLPLVMHGGTGISDEQFREAIRTGISKVNYFTNISITAVENIRLVSARPQATIMEILESTQAAYNLWGNHLFEIFRTAGKA
jgi:fructose-bisphosphate aldolase class II